MNVLVSSANLDFLYNELYAPVTEYKLSQPQGIKKRLNQNIWILSGATPGDTLSNCWRMK